jgi:hypothetical protein
VIIFVISLAEAGRILAEDCHAFRAMNEAFHFQPESTILVFNRKPSKMNEKQCAEALQVFAGNTKWNVNPQKVIFAENFSEEVTGNLSAHLNHLEIVRNRTTLLSVLNNCLFAQHKKEEQIRLENEKRLLALEAEKKRLREEQERERLLAIEKERLAKENLVPINVPVYIRCRHSNLVLDVCTGGHGNCLPLIQHPLHGGGNQRFIIEKVSNSSPSTPAYYMIRCEHSGRYLDVSGGSHSDCARIIQHDRHGGDNQQFRFEYLDGGYFFIYCKHSGKVLDISSGGCASNLPLIQHGKHGGNNQQFLLASPC